MKIAERGGTSKSTASKGLNIITDQLTELLSNGEKVTFPGFGTFEAKERAERKGRNPQTGEEITIPARRVAQFKAGSALKEAVKQKT